MQCCLSAVWAKENRAIVDVVQGARTAGVSENDLNRMLTAGYRYTVAEKDLALWIESVGTAAAQALPATPLVDKLEEGLSKKVPSRRISEVLAQQIEQLRSADRLVKEFGGRDPMAPAAVTRTADLLAAGLTPEEVRQVFNTAPAIGMP